MKRFLLKSLLMGLLAVAIAAPSVSQAQSSFTIEVLTAGSSAQFYVFAEAAYQLAKAGGTASHYTAKNAGFVHDNRGAGVPDEEGNLWVVWNSAGQAWAYLSVDSTVGVRAFESAPRASLTFPSTLPGAGNIVTTWDDNSTDVALPSALHSKLTNATFTAANTDIRPEDALYATNHYHGSGTGCTGTIYRSASSGSTATANVVKFALTGNDPCATTHATVPLVTIPVGAAPVVFLVNSSDTASGHLGNSAVKNISGANADKLFDGTECDASLFGGNSSVPVTAWLREPLSGTMNTTEFSVFQVHGPSQETGVTTNPLNQTCSSGRGSRKRGIGTGEIVSDVSGNTDNAGYIFFSYEAVNGKTNLKYVTLDGIDPFTGTYSGGTLPTCLTGKAIKCTVTPNRSFATLREGTYKAWSVYRVISDDTGAVNAQKLVARAQNVTSSIVPDFVPFSPVCGSSSSSDEKGLDVYREHFSYSVSKIQSIANNTVTSTVTSTPNDGPIQASIKCTVGPPRSLPFRTLGGYIKSSNTDTEVMGDVGGVIQGPFAGNPPVPGPTTSVNR